MGVRGSGPERRSLQLWLSLLSGPARGSPGPTNRFPALRGWRGSSIAAAMATAVIGIGMTTTAGVVGRPGRLRLRRAARATGCRLPYGSGCRLPGGVADAR